MLEDTDRFIPTGPISVEVGCRKDAQMSSQSAMSSVVGSPVGSSISGVVSRRARELPANPFAQADARVARAVASGLDVIDLSKGNPDGAPPRFVQEALARAAFDPADFPYPHFDGKPEFLAAAAQWYKRQHGVDLDPKRDLLATNGSSVGISTVIDAFIDPGDTVVVPGPYYPQYEGSTAVAGGVLHAIPTDAAHHFLPDLDSVDARIWHAAKLLILNYPNNPTGASATAEFYEHAVQLAHTYGFAIMNDFAYAGLSFDAEQALSLLSVPHALDVSVELCSLSKMYMVAGWRGGFVAGNPELMQAVKAVHRQTSVLASTVIQSAGTIALNSDQSSVGVLAEHYRHRHDVMVEGLQGSGLRPFRSHGGLFLWAGIPDRFSSDELVDWLIQHAHVGVMPGSCFGPGGEGYVRLSLLRPESDLKEAAHRIREALPAD